jgi:hypothetical protein
MIPSALFLLVAAAAATPVPTPAPADPHAGHHAGVDSRGDQAMGFQHELTAHHFLLARNGGVIQITANDAKDTESRDEIRRHLGHIAKMFAAGDFSAPMFIHDPAPPGIATMKRLKAQILYAYEPIERGGRLRITTKNPEAIAAIHEFLRLQIKDHRTGDPVTPPASR